MLSHSHYNRYEKAAAQSLGDSERGWRRRKRPRRAAGLAPTSPRLRGRFKSLNFNFNFNSQVLAARSLVLSSPHLPIISVSPPRLRRLRPSSPLLFIASSSRAASSSPHLESPRLLASSPRLEFPRLLDLLVSSCLSHLLPHAARVAPPFRVLSPGPVPPCRLLPSNRLLASSLLCLLASSPRLASCLNLAYHTNI